MSSTSPDNATRWGSSVQLTKRGVNAVSRFWDVGKMKNAFTPGERIQDAKKRVGDIIKPFHFDITNL